MCMVHEGCVMPCTFDFGSQAHSSAKSAHLMRRKLAGCGAGCVGDGENGISVDRVETASSSSAKSAH